MNTLFSFSHLGGVRAAGGGEFQPMAADEFISIEKEIGVALPDLYKTLLTRYGAFTFHGRSEDNPIVYFRSRSQLPDYITRNNTALFDYFYGAENPDGPQGLSSQIEYYNGRIPNSMIPIGGDGGAGQICLGINESDKGKVFYWDFRDEPLDEETYLKDCGEPMPPEAKRHNVYLIADSFADFLDRLVIAPA